MGAGTSIPDIPDIGGLINKLNDIGSKLKDLDKIYDKVSSIDHMGAELDKLSGMSNQLQSVYELSKTMPSQFSSLSSTLSKQIQNIDPVEQLRNMDSAIRSIPISLNTVTTNISTLSKTVEGMGTQLKSLPFDAVINEVKSVPSMVQQGLTGIKDKLNISFADIASKLGIVTDIKSLIEKQGQLISDIPNQFSNFDFSIDTLRDIASDIQSKVTPKKSTPKTQETPDYTIFYLLGGGVVLLFLLK